MNRHGMQAIPVLAHARVESSQRRIAPRRSAQVLRGRRRRSRLLHDVTVTFVTIVVFVVVIVGAFTSISGGRRRVRIRVRHRRGLLHAQWTPPAERVRRRLRAARRARRVRRDRPRGRRERARGELWFDDLSVEGGGTTSRGGLTAMSVAWLGADLLARTNGSRRIQRQRYVDGDGTA